MSIDIDYIDIVVLILYWLYWYWFSIDFVEIPPWRDENFPYEHAQVGQPAKAE